MRHQRRNTTTPQPSLETPALFRKTVKLAYYRVVVEVLFKVRPLAFWPPIAAGRGGRSRRSMRARGQYRHAILVEIGTIANVLEAFAVRCPAAKWPFWPPVQVPYNRLSVINACS